MKIILVILSLYASIITFMYILGLASDVDTD